MRIDLADFGGIMPRVDPVNLPENGAQVAHNVNLSGGTLRPLADTNAYTRLHDDDGEMLPGIDLGDIASIPQAGGVSVSKFIPMAVPWWKSEGSGAASLVYGWVLPTAYLFFEYLNDDDEFVTDEVDMPIKPDGVYYTPSGFVVRGKPLLKMEYTFLPNRVYRIYGPIIKLELPQFLYRAYVGGPDKDYVFPAAPTAGDEQIPSFAIPLVYPTTMDQYVDNGDSSSFDDPYTSPTAADLPTYQYGTLQCTDYEGPQKTGSYQIVGGDSVTETLVPTDTTISLTFECNYTRNRQQTVYYLQQLVDSEGRDGPESDVSAEVIVPPGKFPKLSVTATSGYTSRLYRSALAGSGFLKVGDISTPYYDMLRQSLQDDLPPNGPFPHASVEIAARGAIVHPAGYTCYYYGNELRPSSEWDDYERPWTVPPEYAKAFDSEIQCLALAGGTILVFTLTAVYAVSGQHPARLAAYRVSDKPILDKVSLWEMGGMVGWSNEEGIVVAGDGASASLLTGEHMRAEDWQALTPSGYEARVNDRAVCLFRADGADGLRFDFGVGRSAAISTFDATNGLEQYIWKSKLYRLPVLTAWYAIRVVADAYPVLVRFFADGIEAGDVLAMDDKGTMLPRFAPARQWEFQIEGRTEVRSVAIATSMTEV